MKYIAILLQAVFLVSSCVRRDANLRYALEAAGENRSELETVLEHYKDNPEKLDVARFLIENMPAHFSYAGNEILKYYDVALKILKSDLGPAAQRDTLLTISIRDFPTIEDSIISDIKVITSDFLIHSIDQAFKWWKENDWSSHVSFDEFKEWILPYKTVEYQQLDGWRDTLTAFFSEKLLSLQSTDEGYGTAYRALDAVRNEIISKVKPYGVYTGTGYPLLSASTLPRQTYGSCANYVCLGVSTYRSMGIPAMIDYTPCWGRYRAGHTWYTLLSDQGKEMPSEWDISSVPGNGFFQYERIPKVYRNTYAVNPERLRYRKKAKFRYPFNLCEVDVTDHYMEAVDIDVLIKRTDSGGNKIKLKDKYCYIAVFNGHSTDWQIIDYGIIRKGRAHFTKIGRNIIYIAYGFDGLGLIPISEPFILGKNGSLRYIHADNATLRNVDIRRKYYQSENVINMRRRLLGGKIQCANHADFRDAVTLYEITNTDIPDKISITTEDKYRYWRYLSADGSYGSIAELAFFDSDTAIISGKPISNTGGMNAIHRAFDGDWLSNFETDFPNGNWIGIDAEKPVDVRFVRVVPRSDDNDICPGNEYELFYWTDGCWESLGNKIADDNILHYENVPSGALLWLRNYTRGWDERPFLVDSDGNVEWR
jgi:hypothetical protein